MSHVSSVICLWRLLLISCTPSSCRMKIQILFSKWCVLVTPAVKRPKDRLISTRDLNGQLYNSVAVRGVSSSMIASLLKGKYFTKRYLDYLTSLLKSFLFNMIAGWNTTYSCELKLSQNLNVLYLSPPFSGPQQPDSVARLYNAALCSICESVNVAAHISCY